ncbi:class I SAM-dependent methyltransferase [Bifidobacterium tibiigranuli]|jgi:SAM-dependent methyltransferase|uniref:class I SAM-dependent methyltransferase n=1 Tax=Bifidobacterium tibiigranuli TaxID=2172043 RepID=UPI0026EDE61E|nr:class I SAM-dependent methyltransferase [Bifidobacterium tibiigranuli]MCI1650199.1 class I SAM-dependent methyltransferase [Bifidobacterium tibiigranuli]MCI1673896.1 class I SAM-dependent methyltransferase [Bifidobacterium tibiigranuli]MCI1712145.1 class I SAM-dependent methyltransferase [Bifidobacterium tibiigranuli]MCI1834257.1 class I SAM-dependent methyltransferase [Bifidobacterium tibiigranuli]MCI2185751.1 class I SAM-dependent methyltransferase [Bifidobacterium tibiigranuli]
MTDIFNHEYFDDFEREHPNIFASKLALLKTAITLDDTRDIGYAISVGAGTGSYEAALREEGLDVQRIVEPSANLAAESRRRGFNVTEGLIQDVVFEDESIDTVFYNGSAFGFIDETTLATVFRQHYQQLKPSGVIALLDVPPASALGLAVQASFSLSGESYVSDVLSQSWYAADTPRKTYWRTTEQYRSLLAAAGFTSFATWQTLRRHLIYHNDAPERAVEGYQEGSYVALVARK